MAVPAPTAGQTAYDYFMANFGAAIGLREFFSLMSDGAVDLAALRQTVLTAVFDEGLTVGELYDMFARSVDAGVRAKFGRLHVRRQFLYGQACAQQRSQHTQYKFFAQSQRFV